VIEPVRTGRSMIRATVIKMHRSLHVRLDDSSAAALSVISNEGLSDSEAVRTALREAAARRQIRSSIVAEVERLAGDDADRAEMRAVREQMAELVPESID
jgi:Arc/MetJ-type ribon-helix-helix transcriptional regulator